MPSRQQYGLVGTADVERQADGSILIRNPWPLHGLPKGFSDLFGWRAVTITPEMVGQTLAQFLAVELKAEKCRPTPEQQTFIAAVQRDGCRAGIARSVEDAERLAVG